MKSTIVLFGESEKGQYQAGYLCHSLIDLCSSLGNCTNQGNGIPLAIQLIMLNYSVLFFRVEEEGFNAEHYFFGANFLNKQKLIKNFTAIAIPGVGDNHIIEAFIPICHKYQSFLVLNEQDLYDLLTF